MDDDNESVYIKTPAPKPKVSISKDLPISSPVPNLTSLTPAEVERRFARVESDDEESVTEISVDVVGEEKKERPRVMMKIQVNNSDNDKVNNSDNDKVNKEKLESPRSKLMSRAKRAATYPTSPEEEAQAPQKAILPPILFDDFLFPGGWEGADEDTEPEMKVVERF
ncbi:hypothetical protein TrCOL_g959 [Triparma columacea]|uniref:Uncharacterized protein n=1 Tax=Triparma columacea TaxID=722753 RepID=A0A9W7GD59_9STRA|nr:hypothetical protein TrCOL_g959 [Triparma columacea]